MKRITWFLMPALLLALTASAFAQGGKGVTTDPDMKDTVSVTLSGHADMDFVYRSKEILETAAGGNQRSATAIEGNISLALNVELTEKVSATVELSTLTQDATLGRMTYGRNTEGSAIWFTEANVKCEDFFQEGLDVTAGIAPKSWKLRSEGGSLVWDPRNSGSFIGDMSTGVAVNIPTGWDELQATGLIVEYERDQIKLMLAALPSVIEGGAGVLNVGGNPNNDESNYVLGGTYDLSEQGLGEGSQIGLMAAIFDGPDFGGGAVTVYTIGGGVDLFGLVENLEVYGEVYFQFGDAGRAGTQDIDAGGLAIQLGAKYNFQHDVKPWLEAKLTWFSGDDNNADADEENFLGYESVEDLAILESQYWGLNVSSNYMAIKVSGGIVLSVADGQDNLEIDVIAAIANTSEDIVFSPTVSEDALGSEIDVNVTYHVNKQLNFNAGAAFVFGSDIMENATADQDDSAMLFRLGCDLKF